MGLLDFELNKAAHLAPVYSSLNRLGLRAEKRPTAPGLGFIGFIGFRVSGFGFRATFFECLGRGVLGALSSVYSGDLTPSCRILVLEAG